MVLRYPGGKSRAVDQIIPHIPAGDLIISPFFGGGAVELELLRQGIDVTGNDAFEPVAMFWVEMLGGRASEIARIANNYLPLHPSEFGRLQRMLEPDQGYHPIDIASAFFVVNRASFSGLTLSGGMSPGHPRFTESSIQRLIDLDREIDFSRLDFAWGDYREFLDIWRDDQPAYFDPPYMGKRKIYGRKGDLSTDFCHDTLCEILKGRTNWLLSYNDTPKVRDMYKDYRITEIEFAYGMDKKRQRTKELLIHG